MTYCDLKTNFGIQLADLTVNTFYNKYKNIDIVKDVLKSLKTSKYRVSVFLDNKTSRRIKKDVIDSVAATYILQTYLDMGR